VCEANEGLSVWQDERARKHFQKHPVISVTFKDVKAKTLAGTMAGIREQFALAFGEYQQLLDDNQLDSAVALRFRRILDGTVADAELPYALMWLSHALYKHYGKRVVILIDEYDTPVQSGYLYEFFDDIVLFFRNFFSACLKDNVALFKGVLTGILRVPRENMFSGLNHIMVHSIIDTKYSTAFGFTEDEVAAIIEPERLQEVRSWYNGYIFGGHVIYNPWSILHYIHEGLLKPTTPQIVDQMDFVQRYAWARILMQDWETLGFEKLFSVRFNEPHFYTFVKGLRFKEF